MRNYFWFYNGGRYENSTSSFFTLKQELLHPDFLYYGSKKVTIGNRFFEIDYIC